MKEIYLYGEVGVDFTAKSLAGLTGDLSVHINSGGGNVYDGLAIYNLLKKAGAVEISIDGLCASAASIIACAGHVTMAENGIYMIHLPLAGLDGYFNSADLEGVQKSLDAVKSAIIATYQAKTGKSAAELTSLIESESWLSAAEAKELGFVDEISGAVESELHGQWLIMNGVQFDCKGLGAEKLKALAKEKVTMENEVMAKYKESVLTAERTRIKNLSLMKNGVAEIDAVIDAAIATGKEAAEVTPYLDAIKKAQAARPAANALEELKALIRDNMKSGAEGVEGSAEVTDSKFMQAELVTKYANEMVGAKNG